MEELKKKRFFRIEIAKVIVQEISSAGKLTKAELAKSLRDIIKESTLEKYLSTLKKMGVIDGRKFTLKKFKRKGFLFERVYELKLKQEDAINRLDELQRSCKKRERD